MRVLVPRSFPAGTSSAVAFRAYQQLPPSLLKTQHELDAKQAVGRWVSALNAAGQTEIRHVLPSRKLWQLLKALEPHVAQLARDDESSHFRKPLVIESADLLATACKQLIGELTTTAHAASGADAANRSAGDATRAAGAALFHQTFARETTQP